MAQLSSKAEAEAVLATLPAVPNLGHQRSFWVYQVWRRPLHDLVIWALEWRDQGGMSVGTHGRLLWIPEGPTWAVEYHTLARNWVRVGYELMLIDAAEALLRHLKVINAEDRLRSAR